VTHVQSVSLKLRDLRDRMKRDNKNMNKAMARALSGKGAHTEPGSVFAGLDWKVVSLRPDHVAHSLFQLLNDMVFWQDWVISWLDGTKPPSASGSWRSSQGPASRDEWNAPSGVFGLALITLRVALGRRICSQRVEERVSSTCFRPLRRITVTTPGRSCS